MIIDALWLFDSASSLTGNTSSLTSSNVVDLVHNRDMGVGDTPALKLVVLATTAFTSTNSATLSVVVQGSTDNTSYTDMVLCPATSATTVTAGTRVFDIDMPRIRPGQSLPRYYRLKYNFTAGQYTTGAVTSYFCLDRDDIIAYPAGLNVNN